MLEELATLDELHDEVDAVGFLEDVVHANDEGMVNLVKDELLDLERLDRLVLDDHILSNALHGVELIILFVVDEVDFAESTATDNANQLEVVPVHLRDGGAPIETGSARVPAIVRLVLGHFAVQRPLVLHRFDAASHRVVEFLFVEDE